MSHSRFFSRRALLGAGAFLAATSRSFAQPLAAPAQAKKLGLTPHTRFALNAEIWFGDKPFLERVRAAADLGYPSLEFWPWRGKDLAALGKLCAELRLEIAQFTAWGFTPGMNDPANHAAVELEITESCKVANDLGCKLMTVVGGNDQPGMTRDLMHAHITSALKRVAPIAEQHGVTLILEPMNIRVDHKGHCLYGTEAAVKICRAVNSPFVKVNWDLYHAQLAEGDLCGHLADGFDQLGYAQVADTPGRNEPGTGEIHYPRVLKQLHELGYRGYVGLECWPKDGEAKAAERVWAADSWS
ncbi:MAG: TIM barrel protein [Planctomycetes bacterium]|nr:TIM barrel protein [Planctomycetota bacterium]